uniref:ST8 alpha-N-acetyl-neuraminide alpha-2,8-sialyltransferase 1 n=1 Tax=Canis lupus dingo TaxID=286419 RepID=A0A8C0QZU4_CANLU
MSPCGRARRHTSRGAMAILAWKFPRTRLPVGASALCVVVLCWLYIFPVYRLPNEKEIVQGVLQQGTAWRRNQTIHAYLFINCGICHVYVYIYTHIHIYTHTNNCSQSVD